MTLRPIQPSGQPQRSVQSTLRRQKMLQALEKLSNGIAGGQRTDMRDFLATNDPAIAGAVSGSGVGPGAGPPDLGEVLDPFAAGIDVRSEGTPPAPESDEAAPSNVSTVPTHADVVEAATGLTNGRIPADQLTPISGANPGGGQGFLLEPAAVAWEAMRADAAAAGVALHYTSTYRTWESQNAAYQKYKRGERGPGVVVAPPGTSKHGAGVAVDISTGSGIISKGSAQWKWLSQNAARYGWYGISSESWHWEFRGT